MRHILVTGAANGIGRAVAEYLAAKGDHVYACDVREASFESELITAVRLDVRSVADVERAFAKVAAQSDHLDAIVHFAGIYMMGSLVEMSEAEFLRIFDVNVNGVYRVNKVFLPLLMNANAHSKKANGKGKGKGAQARIIITSSEVAPLGPLPFNGIYSITKTAVDRYAHSLRFELALLECPIAVVVVRPGAVRTELLQTAHSSMQQLCASTQLFKAKTAAFKSVMDKHMGFAVPPERIARLVQRILDTKRPSHVYSVNTNIGLKLMSALPIGLQISIIKWLLR
jgi:NAD(P)-dependent dehydrogenase (short-subunit alcohol dehydrogenase family)